MQAEELQQVQQRLVFHFESHFDVHYLEVRLLLQYSFPFSCLCYLMNLSPKLKAQQAEWVGTATSIQVDEPANLVYRYEVVELP